ncbi:MAG: PIG-L family deacetylase [Deltaproteobacteria bacterium]|nr:PIG-L family deacetylase [Deltaproteobacteria bacterium]
MSTVLVMSAHMDDETLGCGGAIARHAAGGDEVHVCVMTDSSSTQYPGDTEKLQAKYAEAQKVAKILGVHEVHHLDFPDMRLDTVAMADLAGAVIGLVHTIKPEIIYTHHPGDRNKDHPLTYEATMVAARPQPGHCVRRVLTYEVLSSTEWGEPHIPFVPNHFVEISAHLDAKIAAMACYTDELREAPHPRSLEAIRVKARDRGMSVGLEHAEAFCVVYDLVR